MLLDRDKHIDLALAHIKINGAAADLRQRYCDLTKVLSTAKCFVFLYLEDNSLYRGVGLKSKRLVNMATTGKLDGFRFVDLLLFRTAVPNLGFDNYR